MLTRFFRKCEDKIDGRKKYDNDRSGFTDPSFISDQGKKCSASRNGDYCRRRSVESIEKGPPFP